MKTINLISMLLLVSVCLLLGCLVPLVRNGTQIESAMIPIAEFDRIIIPETWAIEEASDLTDEIQLKINKTLGYAGIPPEPISLDDVVSGLGVVQKVEGTGLKLREFGGLITSSGGTSISVSIVVPKGTHIKTAAFENLGRSELNSEWKTIKSTVVRKEYVE